MSIQTITVPDFRTALCRCLLGSASAENLARICPKNAGLIDPQSVGASALFMFRISKMKRVILNRVRNYSHLATLRLDIELEAVGTDAEQLMQTTMFWDERVDVVNAFADVNSQLLNTNREVVSYMYNQDGLNTMYAYKTLLKLVTIVSLTEEHDEDSDIRAILLRGDILTEG